MGQMTFEEFMARYYRDHGVRLIKHDPTRSAQITKQINELNRQGKTAMLYIPGPDEADGETPPDDADCKAG